MTATGAQSLSTATAPSAINERPNALNQVSSSPKRSEYAEAPHREAGTSEKQPVKDSPTIRSEPLAAAKSPFKDSATLTIKSPTKDLPTHDIPVTAKPDNSNNTKTHPSEKNNLDDREQSESDIKHSSNIASDWMLELAKMQRNVTAQITK